MPIILGRLARSVDMVLSMDSDSLRLSGTLGHLGSLQASGTFEGLGSLTDHGTLKVGG